jgi:Mce-associated membrane protein
LVRPVRKPATAPDPALAEAGEAREPARRHTRWWPSVVAVVLALGLLATVVVLSTRPALTQQEREAAVGSARTSLETLLSYSGSSFDAHVAEVTPQLASPFKEEFTKVATTDIKPMAVKNGATVLAKVYDAGVMDTSGTGGAGTTVRVLAFVNQATTTKAQPTPAIDQNRVIATMTKVGGRWLISRLEAF